MAYIIQETENMLFSYDELLYNYFHDKSCPVE